MPLKKGFRSRSSSKVRFRLCRNQKRGARAGSPLPGAPRITRGFIGNRPSRCSFLRASLRAWRIASAFSRTLFSEGFRNGRGASSPGRGPRAASSSAPRRLGRHCCRGRELCMRRSSSIERLMGPDDQGARATGARIRKVPVPMAAEERTNADVRNRPADEHHRCQLLPYVAGFWAALRTSSGLPVTIDVWCRDQSTMVRREFNSRSRRQSPNWGSRRTIPLSRVAIRRT